MASLIGDLPKAIWCDKGDPPQKPHKEEGYRFYTLFRRADQVTGGVMTYYLSTGEGAPIAVNLNGVTRDPLRDIHKCYFKLDSNIITGIILDRDWVEQKDTAL